MPGTALFRRLNGLKKRNPAIVVVIQPYGKIDFPGPGIPMAFFAQAKNGIARITFQMLKHGSHRFFQISGLALAPDRFSRIRSPLDRARSGFVRVGPKGVAVTVILQKLAYTRLARIVEHLPGRPDRSEGHTSE